MSVLRIDTERYAQAADLSAIAGRGLTEAADSVGSVLLGTGGMAGWDATGADWSASYDPAALDVLSACHDLAHASWDTSRALTSAAGNYIDAEHIAAMGLSVLVQPTVPRAVHKTPAPRLPSASDANPGWPPPCWDIIAGIAGVAWPSGDPELLRSAGRAWTTLAEGVETSINGPAALARHLLDGLLAEDLILFRERSLAVEESGRLVAEASREIARGCESLASAVDDAHQELIEETQSFALECGALMAVGAAFSLVTLGGSAMVTAVVGTARTTQMVLRVHQVLIRLSALARTVSIAAARLPGAAGLTAGLRTLATSRGPASAGMSSARSAVTAGSRTVLASQAASRLAPAVRIIRPVGAAGLRALDSKAVSLILSSPAELVVGQLSYQLRRTALGSRVVRGSGTDQVFALLRNSPVGTTPIIAIAERVVRNNDRIDAAGGLLALPGTIRDRTAPHKPARLPAEASGPGRLTTEPVSPVPRPRAGSSRDRRISRPAASQ